MNNELDFKKAERFLNLISEVAETLPNDGSELPLKIFENGQAEFHDQLHQELLKPENIDLKDWALNNAHKLF
jgi:hypothetical protein